MFCVTVLHRHASSNRLAKSQMHSHVRLSGQHVRVSGRCHVFQNYDVVNWLTVSSCSVNSICAPGRATSCSTSSNSWSQEILEVEISPNSTVSTCEFHIGASTTPFSHHLQENCWSGFRNAVLIHDSPQRPAQIAAKSTIGAQIP